VPGVEAITSLRLSTTRIGEADVQVIGLNPQTYPQVASLIYSQGDEATAVAELENGRNIIVNGILAAQNGINMGDTLAIQTAEGVQQYQVIAIAGDFLNYKLATTYISQENLAQDFKETNDVLVMVNQTAEANPAEVESQLKEIASRYPAINFYSLAEWEAEMGKTLAAFNGMYVMLVVLALPSLIALINTLAISVLERTREIGTLRAVGATRRQIRRLITAESLLLAATGTLFGLLSGLWLSYVLVGAMNFVGLTFTFSFSFAGIILAIVVGLGFGIVGALIPARQAAQLDIVRALAYE
jgi:putative ABC transport system permease protein